jgi:SpoVK/Ycf46/Vps4 family AAA+-type ATPase
MNGFLRRNADGSWPMRDLVVDGLPETISKVEAAVCRSRLLTAIGELGQAVGPDLHIRIYDPSGANRSEPPTDMPALDAATRDELDIERRSRQFQATPTLYQFDFLVLSDRVREDVLSAISLLQLEHRLFDAWGLRSIEPFPCSALNFYGPPGTGKTLAAHAIAHHLGRPIMAVSYAQVESKFHGEGPKNVVALFHAAEREDAVLFIDEADSLLSRRLTEVHHGSEQAINSMRSQLLISLGQFRGIVIFATNLIENYDSAFETRVRHIHFPLPDHACRREIWGRHLPSSLPRATDIDLNELAGIDDVCGRDIKNAVIDAAVRTAMVGREAITQADLAAALTRIKEARVKPAVPMQPAAVNSDPSLAEEIEQALDAQTDRLEPQVVVDSVSDVVM